LLPASREFADRNLIFRSGLLLVISKGMAMRSRIVALATAVMVFGALAHAQSGAGVPSGRGSTTGDPAASSATPGTAPHTAGNAMKPSRSGSGTSTSGGSDANGDQGRDKMPDSNMSVMPLDRQHKPN
jgi:hypothetical protein